MSTFIGALVGGVRATTGEHRKETSTVSGTNRKRAAKKIAAEQGITYMQALDVVLTTETATPAVTGEVGDYPVSCVHCTQPIYLTNEGWVHENVGLKSGGKFCNPEFTFDHEHTFARADDAEAGPVYHDLVAKHLPEFVSVTAVFDRSTVTVSVPFPAFDLADSEWGYVNTDEFENDVAQALANEGVTEDANDFAIDGTPLEDALPAMIDEAFIETAREYAVLAYEAAEMIYSRTGASHVIDFANSVTAYPIPWGVCGACDSDVPLDPADPTTCLICGSPVSSAVRGMVSPEGISAVSDNGMVKVEWTFIGEGMSGEFDEDDPDDVALMRYDAYVLLDADETVNDRRGVEVNFCDASDVWGIPQDGSYCTQTPYDTDIDVLRELARLIANRLADDLDNGGFKRTAEDMSYAHPEWVQSKG